MAIHSVSSIVCEQLGCSEQVDVTTSHSLWAVLQKVDASGYSFFQCEEGQEYNDVNYQHFCCCHQHMQQHMMICLNDHYKEELLHAPRGGSTILHKVVLKSNLSCKICQSSLSQVAYRFCLTQGLPQNRVPDESLDSLGEWCCSLDHARQATLAIIASMDALEEL